ncbi:exopolyphosphatase/guanosine-5'-triphosphate,3'-diphosphate pyrophosphatase [Planomicrobium stackebrandtii]|uniref:Exopolyphosphatase n=1 Tax=Planomicrobium stackebrandtii TaxID=253160 RepID=A0ABU0H2A7_9BACL|nr:exopolyphosphatase [Planomicrobium stackebrandtii]MDQ0430915.1 exopolyphosphatase/guanosine-5'-triphosphate,3'-diphosphate pyrophosphatase [Planomicrobium stackebrandtii]
MEQEKYAIIDIGSNTIRLVIYTRDKSGRFTESENVKAVARLRNYLNEDNLLEREGIDILVKTLKSFQEVTRHHQLKAIKCVATAAVRQAENQDEIMEAVESETDFTIRILSEFEEANYGYLAVVNSTPFTSGITVDIGGGSTEITYFNDRQLIYFYSFPFGALSLKQQFIQGNTPTKGELRELRSFLKEQFDQLEWLADKRLPLIGIGGSARNMAQIHQEHVEYPLTGVHQYRMSRDDVEEMNDLLKSLEFSDLQRLEGLSKDRADIIIPALEVFRYLMELIDTEEFALSRKGLRDGVFYEETTKDFDLSVFPNVVEESFHELAIDYDINLTHAFHVTNSALLISKELEEVGMLSLQEEDYKRLKLSSALYNLGSYIDSESSHQHTFYLLSNRTIDGLLHKERVIVALMASFKNKETFKRNIAIYEEWFGKEELAKYSLLGAIIKLAYSLNATKRDIVETIELEEKDDKLIFSIRCSEDWKPEQYQVEKQKKHLEKQLKKTIDFKFYK